MTHYKITDELRRGVNNFLGVEYIEVNKVGEDLWQLENYETISRVSPEKVKLLHAVLFPEKVKDTTYFRTHKGEIQNLAKRLHVGSYVGEVPHRSWSFYMIRREYFPPSLEGKQDEDILSGNIVRFR